MNMLIAVIPAIGWGLQPLLVRKIGGKPANQILGTGIGAVLVGVIVFGLYRETTDTKTFLLAILSGAFWVMGQVGQYISFEKLGVSRTMPISTGLQLVGNSLIGIIMFGEWPGITAKLIGFLALVIVLVGVILTALTDETDSKANTKKDILLLICTTLGYWIYSTFPRAVEAEGKAIFLPQMLGILIGALIFLLLTKQTIALQQKTSWLNSLVGLVFGLSALFYIFSAKENGVVTAFIITQLSVVFSTLSGLIFLHEHKDKKHLILTMLGLALIVIGSIITASIK